MPISKKFMIASVTSLALATSVFAASHASKEAQAAVKARQSHMQLYSFNLGILGGMAKGNMDYNAEAAGAAAANLAALANMNQMAYWVGGSDIETVECSRTLASRWDNIPDAIAKSQALATAATAMAEVAGTDLAALQGAMGAVGGSCGACHKAYRAPKS